MVFIRRKVSDSSRLWSLFSNTFKRQSSTRVNVTKPREPHPERQKYLILTRPLFEPHPEEFMPQSLKCRVNLERMKKLEKPDNPYERLMGEKIFKMWNDAKMILVFYHNSIKGDEHYKYQVLFYRQQMEYKKYLKSLMVAGLTNTKFENVLQIIDPNTCFVISPEVKIQEALKITKKTPNLILLTAILDNRILSRAEIMKYNQFGNVTNARAELVSTLNAAGQSLVSTSTGLQQNLVSLLDQHISLLKDSSSGNGTTSSEEVGAAAADLASKAGGELGSEGQVNDSSSSGSTGSGTVPSEELGASSADIESKAIGEQKSEGEVDDSSSSSSDSESDSDSDEKK